MEKAEQSVLVVDDVIPIVEEMTCFLELHNIPSQAAYNLCQAKNHLDTNSNIGVVICDVRLGEESGLDLLKHVKSNEKLSCKGLHFVFVTGESVQAQQISRDQDTFVMIKPVQPYELVNLVQDLLGVATS